MSMFIWIYKFQIKCQQGLKKKIQLLYRQGWMTRCGTENQARKFGEVEQVETRRLGGHTPEAQVTPSSLPDS